MTGAASGPTPEREVHPLTWITLVGLLLVPGAALAHGSGPGLDGFLSGFIHPLVEPAHLIALIAFVLLIGQQGMKATHPGLLALCIASGVGLLVAGFGWPINTDVALLTFAGMSGMAVALAKPLPRAAYVIAGIWVGLGIGIASAPDGPGGGPMIATMLGTWAGASIWATNGSSVVEALKRPWVLVLMRVVASWMAACAVLFLALSVAPKKPVNVGSGIGVEPPAFSSYSKQ